MYMFIYMYVCICKGWEIKGEGMGSRWRVMVGRGDGARKGGGSGTVVAIIFSACFDQRQSTSVNNSQQQSTHSQHTVNTTVNKHPLL